jgi:hypothetical protein
VLALVFSRGPQIGAKKAFVLKEAAFSQFSEALSKLEINHERLKQYFLSLFVCCLSLGRG